MSCGGDDVAVIKDEIRVRLALIVCRVNIHDQIKVLGAGGEDGHFGGIAKRMMLVLGVAPPMEAGRATPLCARSVGE